MSNAFKLKQVAFARLSKKNPVFIPEALHYIGMLIAPGFTDIFEGYRLLIEPSIRTAPSHMNVWGNISDIAENHGLIEFTGDYGYMKTDRSHGRESPIYVRTTKPGPENPVRPPVRLLVVGSMFGMPRPRR